MSWVTWHGDQVTRRIADLAEVAAKDAAEVVRTESNRIVPTDPGSELERSAKVSSDGRTAAVSYDTEYAVLQHERLDFAHDPGRSAKFLERALLSSRAMMAAAVHKRMRL